MKSIYNDIKPCNRKEKSSKYFGIAPNAKNKKQHTHDHKESFAKREQSILSSTTRKQYNHIFHNLEMITIQVRLLEYLKSGPQDKKRKKKERKKLFLSDDSINYL